MIANAALAWLALAFSPCGDGVPLGDAGGSAEDGSGPDGPVWRPAPRAQVRPVTRVLPPGWAPLEIRAGRLVRLAPGGPREIGCTQAGGAGEVRDLALDPSGLVFVAAERGLFVLDGRADVLDPVERAEGTPPGAPTSVHVDARRRVWLATEEAFGVLEPSFGWGRTLRPADGLPAGGPYRVGPGPGGSLVLQTPGGAARYRPGAGPAPAVTALVADGRERAPGDTIALPHGTALSLGARGSATGGASFRWRVDGHHVWRAMPDGEASVEGLSPGTHTLDVVAVDRDLEHSAPYRLRLDVAFPRRYEKDVVLAAGGGAALVLLAFFLARARRAGLAPPAAALRAAVSTGLALVVGLQVLAGLVPHAKGWPFVGFSMYCDRYGEGDAVYRPVLVGLLAEGGERRIDPHEVGVAVDSPWQVLRPLIDGGETAARAFLADYRRLQPQRPLRGLQVQARRVRLTEDGAVPVAPLVLAHFVEESDG